MNLILIWSSIKDGVVFVGILALVKHELLVFGITVLVVTGENENKKNKRKLIKMEILK